MSLEIKISLIMNQNSYSGREYLYSLKNSNIKVDVLCVGRFPKRNRIEDQRCGNIWKPKNQEFLSKYHDFYSFDSLKSKKLIDFLNLKKYDIGIQGGTGIISDSIIKKFNLGILNFHPGLLPKYRGCSAPEWQIYEGQKIYSTCHIIDKDIDTGDILEIKELKVFKHSYHQFRASIYIETSKFVVKIIKEIISNKGFKKPPYKQNENNARYLSYIGEEKINTIKKIFKKNE